MLVSPGRNRTRDHRVMRPFEGFSDTRLTTSIPYVPKVSTSRCFALFRGPSADQIRERHQDVERLSTPVWSSACESGRKDPIGHHTRRSGISYGTSLPPKPSLPLTRPIGWLFSATTIPARRSMSLRTRRPRLLIALEWARPPASTDWHTWWPISR
jgi:hypothetical protein